MVSHDVSAVFRAISDPTRREILDLLRDENLNVGDISRQFPVSRPAISSAWASLIKIPNSAPRPLPTKTAVGVANPKAQGQATTKTATAATSPSAGFP